MLYRDIYFLVKGDGKVWAREVTVTLSSPLGDFVFDKDYNLMSLKDLEVYVNKNKHLPGIPSASNVGENGLNVGEFQNLLLQKVEEMSLYIINQDKKAEENTVCIANQNKKIEEMSLLILQLEKRIKELEK